MRVLKPNQTFGQNLFGNPFLLFGMLAAGGAHRLAMHIRLMADILDQQPVSSTRRLQLTGIARLLIVVDE